MGRRRREYEDHKTVRKGGVNCEGHTHLPQRQTLPDSHSRPAPLGYSWGSSPVLHMHPRLHGSLRGCAWRRLGSNHNTHLLLSRRDGFRFRLARLHTCNTFLAVTNLKCHVGKASNLVRAENLKRQHATAQPLRCTAPQPLAASPDVTRSCLSGPPARHSPQSI